MSPRAAPWAVIRRARKARGWSQLELSRQARVSQTYISQLEAGRKRNPSVKVLRKLAKALGVPVTDLLV